MLGKKKKNTDAGADSMPIEPAAPPKTKSSKSRKQSLKGGTNPLVAHIEKAGLFLLAIGALYLAYSSFSVKGLDQGQKDPAKLATEASTLVTQIKDNHWDSIKEDRVKHIADPAKFRNDVVHTRQPVAAKGYSVEILEPALQKDVLEKRKDPKILPPEQVVARSIMGTIATAVPSSDDNPDPFKKLDDADLIKARGAPREKDKKDNPQDGGSSGLGTGPGENGSQVKPKRRLKASYDLGAQVLVAGAPTGGEGEGGGEGGMLGGMGGPGSGGRGGGGGGSLGGNEGGGGGTGGAGGNAGLGQGPKGPTHRVGTAPVMFNAITAVIPHRKNFEEYQNTFLHTGTYNQSRDLPQYLGLEVQRVDVTADPNRQVNEDEWKTILTNREIANMPIDMYKEKNTKTPKYAWATHFPTQRGMTRLGRPIPEVIDPRAVVKGLTAPIPPILLRDYREFSKHPAIAWKWNSKVKRVRSTTGDDRQNSSEDDDVIFGDTGAGAGTGPGGMGGEGGGMGGGMGGRGGGGGDDSSFGDSGDMGFGGEDYGAGDYGYGGEGESGEGGMGGMGGMGGGLGGRGGGGGGSSGMGGGMGGGSLATLKPENQPEFKMIRVYDFLRAADIGKVYRYRLRVKMRDPNYPENQDYNPTYYKAAPQPLPPPENRELDHDVFLRVSKLREADDKVIEENRKKQVYKARTLRSTDWSEPSAPVFVRERSEAFVGEVTDKATIKNIVITQASTDPKLPGAIFAIDMSAERGSVLGLEASKNPLEFIAPTNKLVKKVDGKPILPRLVVVDVRGGQPLLGNKAKDDELYSTGEAMIVRQDGSLIISNTRDDQFLWRMYSFKDDKEAAEKKHDNPGNGGSMGGEGGGPPGGRGG